MCLQGYFHPRNSLLDVYEWIVSQLNDEARAVLESVGKSEGGVLELYTTPPRTVLLPFKVNSGAAATAATSLTDLQLVPAAVLYASWNEAHPMVQHLKSAGLIDTVYANSSVGRYLVESLLLAADEKIALRSGAAFPIGAPLVPSAGSNEGSSSSDSVSKAEKKLDASSESKPKSKPKWFKL